MKLRRIFLTSILIALFVTVPAQAQTPTPPPGVQLVLDSMTPEERVGQLFLVTFSGTDTSESSEIYDLIVRYHVGGARIE